MFIRVTDLSHGTPEFPRINVGMILYYVSTSSEDDDEVKTRIETIDQEVYLVTETVEELDAMLIPENFLQDKEPE